MDGRFRRAYSPGMGAADAMREAARRFRAGESLDGLFAPDCAIHGNPGGWLAAPQGSGFADQLAASDEQQYGAVSGRPSP